MGSVASGTVREGSEASVAGELEIGLGLFFAGFALVAARLYPLWRDHFYVACPLLELTGIPCPTCGGTRALAALAAGRWLEGFAWNPAAAAAGVAAALFVPVALFWLARPAARPVIPSRLPVPVTVGAALLLAANQVYLWIWFGAP